jgi:putative phosphoribosyl transferase
METLKKEVSISVDEIILNGDLSIPTDAKGIVVFAHGSGSSRHSSRNKYVAQTLEDAGFATLLFDLLTPEEDVDYSVRFDIDLLTDRLIKVTEWLRSEEETADLDVGYFGASTGAAATLKAAVALGDLISAVVSRGGRPDLAEPGLTQVRTPTLLIVGGLDTQVIELNEKAFALLRTEKEIRIIPGASHLFEEPGKLEEVANLAVEWFERHLVTVAD